MKLLITLGQAAFAWTWETSLYASLLIILVFCLQKALARWLTPRLRYTISLLVLLRLLLPTTPFSALSVGNLLPPGARMAQPASLPFLTSPTTTRSEAAQPSHSMATAAPIVSEPLRITIFGALGVTWAAGVLSLLMLAGWRLRRWNQLIQKGRRISEPRLVGLLESARKTMKVRRPVQLVAIPELASPAVFGIFQPRLLLPEPTLRQLDDSELRMIFLHEMAHVCRNDALLNYLLMAVQFLHWFNPLVWLALHRLRADRELVCDAMVIRHLRPEERIGYGKVLLRLVENFSNGPAVFDGAAPVIGAINEMKGRILMIKHHQPASVAACVTTALALGVLAFTACTRAPKEQSPSAGPNMVASKSLTIVEKAIESFNNGGPIYRGHPAGYWIFRLKQGSREEQSEARAALRSMGKVAVPFFLQALHAPDLPDQWHAYAASALGEIGPAASEAIPALLQMTNQVWESEPRAALMKIKGESIDGLVRALNEPISDQWVQTAQTLAEFGPDASEAIPVLCRGLDSEKGWAASYAIGFIHSQPEIAVPTLIERIKRDHTDPPVVGWNGETGNAIWALGEFETDASPAIPAIRLHLEDPNPMVRLSCLVTLHKILPTNQAKTLVPDLLKNINDPEPNLRHVARGLLAQIDPEAARRANFQP
jgi:beta-lactamase regulating signal transducer with metallopeptidase domain/HEAT repeat protein